MAAFAGCAALVCCGAEPDDPELSPAARRGHRTFAAFCASCHGERPHQPGPNGPAVAGASRDLLAAKVLHGSYPAGHLPARATALMPRQPTLISRIDDLAAYLAEARPDAAPR